MGTRNDRVRIEARDGRHWAVVRLGRHQVEVEVWQGLRALDLEAAPGVVDRGRATAAGGGMDTTDARQRARGRSA
jgi:hypothetical protein